MPKVIERGPVKSPSGSVPAGIQKRCIDCGSLLETTENEIAIPVLFTVGAGLQIPGWEIACPVCDRLVLITEKEAR